MDNAVVDQTQFIDELQAERFMLPAAAAIAPVITFEAFVTQALQTSTTPVEVDLGPELSDEALVANIAAAIAPTPTLTIVEDAPVALIGGALDREDPARR